MKTWLITGVSRGLGLALARAALERGDAVVGTVRGGRPVLPHDQGRLHVLTLDMAQGGAIDAAVAQAFEIGGRLDVLVNNAGYGLLGAAEDATDAELERLFAVDVFGPFRMIRAALPRLRAQGGGHIVNITSVAGRAPGAGSALYGAAKAALEGISGSLAQELKPFGVKVTAVAPGALRTDALSPHSIRLSLPVATGYESTVGRMAGALNTIAGQQPGDPARVAQVILRIVDMADPPLQLLLGSDALHRARAKLDSVIEEIDRWEHLTLQTDFPT